MIQAELNGKLPEVENSEDVLSSNVFGMLKYLPPQKSIFKILEQTKDYSKQRNSLIDNLNAQNISLYQYDKVNYYFWKYSSVHGEPDLILIIRSSEKALEPLMLCIEAKYLSPKSREGEFDQLKDYCLSLEKSEFRKNYNESDIADFKGNFIGIIYLTYFSQYLDVQESLGQIKKKGFNNYESKLFELRWNDITRVLRGFESSYEHEKMIAEDLVSLLIKKNLMDFEGFPEISFDLRYDCLFSWITKPGKHLHHDFKGFSELKEPGILSFYKSICLGVAK